MFNTLPYVATLGLSPYQLSRHSLVNATKMKNTKNSHGLLPQTTCERYTNWRCYCSSLLFFEPAMLLLPIVAIER